MLTREDCLRLVAEALASVPYDEAELRRRGQEWLLDATERAALAEIDAMDFLMTGRSHGCCGGAHDKEPFDTSWRTD